MSDFTMTLSPGDTLTVKVPAPVITPVENAVTVTSIIELKKAIASDAVDRAVLAAARYTVAPAKSLQANSLWIGTARGANGADMTKRTRPIIVDTSAAIFDGLGVVGGPWFSFMEGAHLIDWRFPVFDRCGVSGDGIIKIGGDPGYAPAHDVKLVGPTVLPTCKGTDPNRDHALYIAHALSRGPYNLAIDQAKLDCSGGLGAAVHVYHSTDAAPNADHVTITNLRAIRPAYGVLLWDCTVHDWLIQGTVDSAQKFDLSYRPSLHGGESASTGSAARITVRLTPTGTHPAGYVPLDAPDRTGLLL